jgi:cell division protein ZapE
MAEASHNPSTNLANLAKKSPLQIYLAQIGQNLVEDSSQQFAIEALDSLYQYVVTTPKIKANNQTKGVYLWGDVGRGKTFLMDLFYQCLPSEGKTRLHFHRFMARIHQELKHHQGQHDPLVSIANKLADEFLVICFDEFFVSDIADAMILAGLFECLFKRGVILVATSNIPIERLYENGLARHKFLPCIALLQEHTQMLHLNGERDHRLHLTNPNNNDNSIPLVLHNIGLTSELDFNPIFDQLSEIDTSGISYDSSEIIICQRPIPLIRAANLARPNAIAWFDFYALCDGPRSQLDYMEIANQFSTIMLSGVPQLSGQIRGWIKARGTEDGIGANQAAITGERIVNYAITDDATRRFISLIDELYDQKVTLYLSCEVPLEEIYTDGALLFEFRRTYSRLMEMAIK